jgi:hypothetical protein
MRFSKSIWVIAAVATLGVSGVALSPAAKAQDVKSADAIVKGPPRPADSIRERLRARLRKRS